MTLTELRYIVAVAREKHFGKAARKCFVSQPTLSLGIKKLEDSLGVLLFERGQKEVVVTPVGLKIVAQAERALKEVNAVREVARLHQDPFSFPLRLGAIHTIGPYLLPSLLPVVREKAPTLSLLIEENHTASIVERLKQGDIDVAIVSQVSNEPNLDTRTVYEEPLVALLPAAHPLTSKNLISINDLDHETVLLLGPQHCFRELVMTICPKCLHSVSTDEDLQRTLEGGSLETIRYMVASGVGVTILPVTAACAARYAQRLVTVRRFEDVKATRSVTLAWRKHFSRMPVVDLIADAIFECNLTGVRMLTKNFIPIVAQMAPESVPA